MSTTTSTNNNGSSILTASGNTTNSTNGESSGGGGGGGGGSNGIADLTPRLSLVTDEWHKEIITESRRNIIRKIVLNIIETNSCDNHENNNSIKELLVKHVNTVIKHAIRLEFEIYEKAKNLDDYFNLLAKSIYLIQKQIENLNEQLDESDLCDYIKSLFQSSSKTISYQLVTAQIRKHLRKRIIKTIIEANSLNLNNNSNSNGANTGGGVASNSSNDTGEQSQTITSEFFDLSQINMKELVDYAKKSEQNIYDKCRCKDEYFQLIAEFIFKLQKDLKSRKLNKFNRIILESITDNLDLNRTQ